MLKVIDGELYNVVKVDKEQIGDRTKNAWCKIENIDNQLRILLQEKNRIIESLADVHDIILQLYPDLAQKLGITE